MRRNLPLHWKPIAAGLAVLIVAVFTWAAVTTHHTLAVTFRAPTYHPDSWRVTTRPASAVPGSSFLGGYELAKRSTASGYATIDVYLARAALPDDTADGLIAATKAEAKALVARTGSFDIGKLGPVQDRPASAFTASFPKDGFRSGATVLRYNVLADNGHVVSVVCRWYYSDAPAGQQGCGDVFTSVRLRDR